MAHPIPSAQHHYNWLGPPSVPTTIQRARRPAAHHQSHSRHTASPVPRSLTLFHGADTSTGGLFLTASEDRQTSRPPLLSLRRRSVKHLSLQASICLENAQAATMSTTDVSLRKSRLSARVWEAARTTVCLNPVIWCLRIYDDNLASKIRRPPDVQELARRARGEPALHPLSRRRKRALTDPLPALEPEQSMAYSIRRSRQRTDTQTMSSFLTKLPFEIRLMIYEQVLAGGDGCEVVHVLRKQGRLGHWRCRMQHGLELCDSKGRRCVEGWLSYKTKVWHLDRSGRLDLITDDGLVPLLRTCRLM